MTKLIHILTFFVFLGWATSPTAALKGDINSDQIIDLKDTIIGLQIVSNTPGTTGSSIADVNMDGKIGLPETIYTLHFIAELRDLPGGCLNAQEKILVDLINNYRITNGLNSVPASRSLTMVAHWHVIDLLENSPNTGSCNLHSWSDQNPDLWSAVCYTPDHVNASGMWDKPSEITDNTYSSAGYENAAYSSGQITGVTAFELWKDSSGHNAIILEQGIWEGQNWQAMGVGVYSHFAVLWFGNPADPQGEVGLCP